MVPALAAAQALFESQRLTPAGEYTRQIEGPAVDKDGNLYVTNLKTAPVKGTIGNVAPGAKKSKLLATLPEKKSRASGIRFDREGRMYVADFGAHKVWVFDPGQTTPKPYFESASFTQPNDLAIAPDGTLYASDPNRQATPKTGKIWRITRGPDGKGIGEVMTVDRTLGVTNGIDLSPDGTTLYVSESIVAAVWAYRIEGAKLATIGLVKKFQAPDVDGLRTDVDGRIYVAMPESGKIAVLTPQGAVVREIALKGRDPTNLTFGGPDGKTVFVTQADGGFIESFRVDRPGREPCMQVPTAC